MTLFDKYFAPYAEYCLRTTFSEDELKDALAKECPACDLCSWKAVKATFGLSNTIVFFCDPDDPLCLHPLKAYRNISRGDLFIRCEKAAGEETILHISIAQSGKYKWLLYYAIGFFALFWGVAASFVIWWGIFLSVVFIGLVFIVLECCHAMAMDEVPQIRQDFEILLRTLERKSH